MKLRAILSALVAVAIAVSIPLASPAEALHGKERIIGKVTDAVTGTPLDNVCVVLGPAASRCWTATNVLGDYVIDLGAIAPPGFSTPVQFFRNAGYASKSIDVVVNNDTDTVVNVTLTRNDGGSGAPPPQPPQENLVQQPPAPPTFTVYLPNITRMLGGRYGWHTPFIVQNVGTANTSLSVKYYNFTDGSLVATRTATVAPGRSYVGSPNDDVNPILPENAQFSVVVSSAGSPVVAVVNEHQGGPGITPEALSYSGFSTGSTKVNLPLVSKLSAGWLTTMIIQNLGAATTSVTGTFRRLDAVATPVTISRVVQPGRSQFIDPRSESTLVAGGEYAVTFTSVEPVAVVANAHNDLAGSPAPMGDSYNGIPNVTNTTTYAPYIPKNTDGVGRSSRVVIQNAGTTAAMPSITLRAYLGGATTTVTAPSIEPGASWAFVPTVADGEYSAVVAGGTFAVVTTAISPATAMFYTGTNTLANKLFIPNLTRKLTLDPVADPGWNTPILIQSADATAATLKWYRFSDGSLVTTQAVPLTAGATTRVDPRTVVGLTDNTQYAVVLESPGQVVAIVTELNLLAGDNAMIYKAFLQP